MKRATKAIYNQFVRRWVCEVVRSGYNNGAYCYSDDPHVGWGCGFRFEASFTDSQMINFVQTLNELETKKRKKSKASKTIKASQS